MTRQRNGHELPSSREGKKQPIVDLCLPEKYPNGHAVKTKKIEDLVKMIPYIPTEHCHFYEVLQEHVTAENVSDDEYGQ